MKDTWKDFKLNIPIIYWTVAFLLAFFRAGSVYFYVGESEKLLGIGLRCLLFTLRFFLYFVLFTGAIYLFDKIIHRLEAGSFEKVETETETKFSFIEKIKCYIPFIVGWFPLLIIKYPAAMCWDTWRMLYEYRSGQMTEHHSVLYSVAMGKLVEIFEAIWNANWGLFLWSFVHYIFCVFAFGYSIYIIKKMKAKKWVIYVTTACYMFNPYISGYIGVAIKDTIYAAAILLLITCLIDMLIDTNAFVKKKWNDLLLFTLFILIYLIRKNGSYTLLFVIFVTLIHCIQSKCSKRPMVIMGLGFVIAMASYGGLGNYYSAIPGSTREALSLPFQQTARYVKEHADDVSEEEKEVINQVLRYDEIAEKYDPRISDPVKSTYKENDEKLSAYFKVWFKHFLRHPLCYIEATWEQNYYLFIPESDNIVFYGSCVSGFEDKYFYEDIFAVGEVFYGLQKWIIKEFNLWHSMPIIGWLGNVSIWCYMFVLMASYCVANKRRCLLPMVPMAVTLIFVVLGPVIQGHPRYMFPLIYSMPVFSCWVIYNENNKAIKIN